MAKRKNHAPLRTYSPPSDEPWFTVHDMGDGLYHLQFAPAGMGVLRKSVERMNPLDAPDDLEFAGVCDLVDSGFCFALSISSEECEDYKPTFAMFDPDDELPF